MVKAYVKGRERMLPPNDTSESTSNVISTHQQWSSAIWYPRNESGGEESVQGCAGEAGLKRLHLQYFM